MFKSGHEYFRLGAESYLSLGRVGKKEKKISCPLLAKFACGQVSKSRLYRLRKRKLLALWKSVLEIRKSIIMNLFKLHTILREGPWEMKIF